MKDRQPQRRSDVFTEYPAQDYATLIVRWPDRDDARLSVCFADAADRLAASYRGGAPDDALLLPFLYLYRHAIELDLKHSIRMATRLRRNNGETDPTLAPTEVNDRLRFKHGHRLMALADELDRHLVALEADVLPKSVRRTFTLLANADPKGESFRYPGAVPDEDEDRINFRALAQAVSGAYTTASCASDILSVIEDHQQEFLGYQADAETEALPGLTADVMAEFEDYAAEEARDYDR